MEKSLTMPKLGATMTEGTVLHWLYEPGAWVTKGEPLLEVMTDKVNIEVEAPITGRLVKILAQDGEVLPIGTPLALLDDAEPQAPTQAPPAQPATAIASTPAAKREAALRGLSLQTLVQAGVKLPLQRADVLAFVEQQQKSSPPAERDKLSIPVAQATPLAQKIAREHQIDLAVVAARKPGEKLTRADIEAHLQQLTQPGLAPPPAGSEQPAPEAARAPLTSQPVQPAAGVPAEEADGHLVALSPIRQIIAKRMQQSIQTAPHIYLDLEVDMTEAERCRQSIGRGLQAQGEPVPSLTALIVRASAAALVLHPDVNAAFEQGSAPGKDTVRHRSAVHIGIATDTERALLTPVIRSAHQLTVPTIARELRRLTLAARQGTLAPDELAGATFTLSNLGMYGIDTFHAIIVPGQSAIMAIGKVSKRGLVVEDGDDARLEIRPVMKVSLSADHRVLDGASGSRFLQQFKLFLENPYLLL